jgi:hypothetical protein
MGRWGRSGLEIAGLSLLAMTLVAFGGVAQLALREDELHLHLAPAVAEKLLRDDPDPRIFAQYLSHGLKPSFLTGLTESLALSWMFESRMIEFTHYQGKVNTLEASVEASAAAPSPCNGSLFCPSSALP